MITYYPGLIEKEPTSDYGVYFPDLPGCISAGETLEEALVMGQEALSFYIEYLVEAGQILPPPTDKDKVTWPPDEQIIRVEMFRVELPDNATKIQAA